MVIKKINRGMILRLLATKKANARVSLAVTSGLTKMSVSNIIDEFIQQKLVEEGEEKEQTNRGKNPISLQFSKEAPKIIGILINREYCSSVLCDMYLNVIYTERMSFGSGDDLISTIYTLIDNILEQEANILGIGLASIGPLDVEKGMILHPPRFYGIGDIPVTRLVEEKYNLPVYLDHQYNSAAKAEKLFGIGDDYSAFIFVGITNGIGAGIYLEGKLLQSNGFGSELGHMSIDYQGTECECGNFGCIENYASAQAICRSVEAETGEQLSFEDCCERSEGSEVINRIILEAVGKLAVILTSIVNLLNPELIILGHESVLLPQKYIDYIKQYINQHKLSGEYTHVSIEKSCFGTETQLLGAACNVLEAVFDGEFFC